MTTRREGPPVMDMASGLGVTRSSGGVADEEEASNLEQDEWLQRARTAYRSSTDWFDAVIRPQVQRNIAHFKSRHAQGSKYHHPTFKARAGIFRPKTRALIRRSEATTAVAFFSTSDLLNITPWNDKDQAAVKRSKIAQHILQHRLEESIPWFLTVCGAAQDAGVTGVCISHQYWNYRTTAKRELEVEVGEGGMSVKEVVSKIVTANRPESDLVPIENFRIDPAAEWRDPINSSPYLIHSVPTYVGDLREMIDEYGRSDVLDESRLWAAAENDHDSIRTARESVAVEKYNDRSTIDDARIVWVRKHIHRIAGIDYYFETVNDLLMLREPEPLEDAFPHVKRLQGKRPYTMGWTVLETHRSYKDSQVQLVDELQQEANDIVNLRLDQAKNAMFGRWKVLRGRNVDTATLLAGIPQSIISVDNMDNVQELRQSDVGQGAFASEDRINTDFDEVSGNFSMASVASNRELNETVGGMNMLSGDASQMKEYEIRMLAETWVEPTLRQVLALEAEYEDDAEVLGIVSAAAKATPADVQDALAMPLKLRVNVGFNATSPDKRVGRIVLGLNAVCKAAPAMAMRINGDEVADEVFGALGFSDSSRFFIAQDGDDDPEKAQLREQVQQLSQLLQGRQVETQSRERIAQATNESRERVATMSARVTWQLGLLVHGINTRKTKLEEVDRMLAAEGNEIKKGELRLQREALSHEINESNRDVKRVLDENKTMKGQQKGAEKSAKDKGPAKLQGDDKPGVVARDRYGDVPFAQG
jgi:hypothetical protein